MEKRTEQEQVRIEKLDFLKEHNIDPYGHRFDRTETSKSIHEKYDQYTKEELHDMETHVKTAGRIMTKRGKGKAGFAHIMDQNGQIQLYVRKYTSLWTGGHGQRKLMTSSLMYP